MADDAAAPDGELSEETSEADDAADETTADESHGSRTRKPRTTSTATAKARMSHVRLATILGLVAVVALAGLCGWLGFRAYESHKAADERNLFLQVGRQAALNLTTIDFEHADEDVQRVLDSSTGTFYDDFQARAQPFKEVVKQAKSKSVGTIAEAGVESDDGGRRRGARRGNRQDVQCRCGRTGAACLADADHGAEGRRRSQGGQREVRIVTENKNVSEETVEDTAARLEAEADCRHHSGGAGQTCSVRRSRDWRGSRWRRNRQAGQAQTRDRLVAHRRIRRCCPHSRSCWRWARGR